MQSSRPVFLAFLVIAFLLVPFTSAADVTGVPPGTVPFIQIDPVGNHEIGDVFFINGTTNLPVTENLTLVIETESSMGSQNFSSRKFLSVDVHDIPVVPVTSPDSSGVNHWSVNGTDSVRELVKDYYCVIVSSTDNSSISDGCEFFYLGPVTDITVPAAGTSSSAQPKTKPPATQSPLPVALPVFVMITIPVLRLLQKKKME